ncbi:GAP family protein [Glycomyces harbinensis]|uniref:Sap, sulfolipid-1-addressing protein n=1 Tax=Glycomyces harbinensis TaxID=58114 RepID=A0A1G6XDA9_9ACTN|nr:GAP family protein [Glycomyces harbinensis]SDD75763.1 Sap, sulfolipid-1-addressing protein [Glycomyces harbinensis]
MTGGLLWGLTGLALLDSINATTIWIVIVILLGAKRPAPTGWAFLLGAAASFLAFALMLYFGLMFADSVLDGFTLWLRRLLFAGLAAALVVKGVRRLRPHERKGYTLPPWVNAWSALPFGVLATVGDLPNAFPMVLAVERLIDSDIAALAAVVVLVGYTLVYVLPSALILAAGLAFNEELREQLQSMLSGRTSGTAETSPKAAAACFAGAAASLAVLLLRVG